MGPAEAVLAGGQGAAFIEPVFLGDEAIDAFMEQYLFVAERKIHYSPSTILAMMFFWISLVPP